MGINGVLEDLPLADVLQFVHLGRRTGTLYLWRDDNRRAEIGFHDGRIVSAWAEGLRKLGESLVESHLLDRQTLDRTLAARRAAGNASTLGQMLLDQGAVSREDLCDVIRRHVQETIFDLVTWRHGSFHFEVDELQPADDFSLAPGQALADLDLNTQGLLLDATRVHDEDSRDGPPDGATDDPQASELERRLRRAGLSRGGDGERRGRDRTSQPAVLEVLRCQVMTDDDELLDGLRAGLPNEQVKVVSIKLREAGTRLPGESNAPVIVLDLRQDRRGLDDVASLARTRPGAPLVAIARSAAQASDALEAGAVAALSADDPRWLESLLGTVRNWIRIFAHQGAQAGVVGPARGGFSSFRRVVFDVQSGLLSATMALNLMHVISESVERAILFLVQEDGLESAGAFGFSALGEPLADKARSLSLPTPTDGALHRALAQAKPLSLDFDEADLPPNLAELVGRPASGQVVVFPVLGAERPIALLYTDNGGREIEIEDIKILELATSQVGVAFENELLRRRLGDLDFEAIEGLDPVGTV